ncbi:hypothetical protein N7466_008747 [Penicillium verhagenii]|uniref:uncharacterized protein n=1 Tax=Penicillium verhagenii TaxID=1562060 RepID=UPI00254558F1|nr:uncharacterized protein N7466_008747 [Penicillium verhagenii]KAJ5924560.1 hypothetical protein N7466_008747 [Penicillium verhagenii]
MADPRSLSRDNVLDVATRALRDDQPSLKTPYEAIALIGHACMAAVDFRLVGLGEDHNIESTETPTLPAEWNANSTFTFRYAHEQSPTQYLLRVSRLGKNAVVNAVRLADDRTGSFDVSVKDFISESALPLSSTDNITAALHKVFISSDHLSQLIAFFKTNVIQELAPGLGKESSEGSTREFQEALRQQPEDRPRRDPLRDDSIMPEPARPYPFDDPLASAPRQPQPTGDFPPPGFEDEFEINRPARGIPPGFGGGRGAYGIGDRDLYPAGLGPHDPLRGPAGPGFGSGGGMHPTFDDPLFGGRGGNGGYDPLAPPGARYDPPGPGAPPHGRSRGPFGGPGGGFGGGGFGGGGFGGDFI